MRKSVSAKLQENRNSFVYLHHIFISSGGGGGRGIGWVKIKLGNPFDHSTADYAFSSPTTTLRITHDAMITVRKLETRGAKTV